MNFAMPIKKVKLQGELTIGVVYKVSKFGWSQN